jgi:hypothetical protein
MREEADEQYALGGVPVVDVWLRDVLWAPRGRGVEVPNPHTRRIVDATVEEIPQTN